MQSGMFTLNFKDVVKGLALAIIVVVIGAFQQALSAHGFDFGSYDWAEIGKIAVEAGIGYLTKNFFSNSQGQVLGKVG